MPNTAQLLNMSIDGIHPLEYFPDEMLIAIGRNFHWRTLLQLSTINKRLYQVFTDDSLWKVVFKSYFPTRNDVTEHFKQEFLAAYKKQIEIERNHQHVHDHWRYEGPLKTLSDAFKDDDEFMSIAINVHSWALALGSERIRNSEYHVDLATSKQYPHVLEHAGEIQKNNFRLVTKLVKIMPSVASYAGNELKKSRPFILFVLENKGDLSIFDSSIRDNEEYVLVGVQNCAANLQHASVRLQDQANIVLPAVSVNGQLLIHGGPNCRDNRTIALAALKSHALAIQFVSDRLCDDLEVMLHGLKETTGDSRFFSSALRKNPELLAITKIRYSFERVEPCNQLLAKLNETTDLSHSNHFFKKRTAEDDREPKRTRVAQEEPSSTHPCPR